MNGDKKIFDVPVVGLANRVGMRETGTTVLAVEAGRTLMLDREEMLRGANEARIAIVGLPPQVKADERR